MKKIFLILIVAILIILLAIASVSMYRYNLLIKIGQAEIEFIENDNFYFESTPINSESNSDSNLHQKLYVNGAKSTKVSLMNNNIISRYYIDEENRTMTIVDEENKTYSVVSMSVIIGNKSLSNLPTLLYNYTTELIEGEGNFLSKMKLLYDIQKISNENCDNTECVKIELKDEIVWLDKDSLLPVKAEFNNNTINYIFTVDEVSESDVTFNDNGSYEQIVNE